MGPLGARAEAAFPLVAKKSPRDALGNAIFGGIRDKAKRKRGGSGQGQEPGPGGTEAPWQGYGGGAPGPLSPTGGRQLETALPHE